MIATHNLSKVYSNGKGVFNVNLKVTEGEVFGFLGPNGAGKTTTIRVLLGFTNPTEGHCTISGLDCRTQSAKIQESLGYIPGEIAFFDDMTGQQFLEFMADMRGTKNTKPKDKLIERFELESDRPIHKMSKGMKQKLAIVGAFMHDPEVLILDEPTSGLDPLMQRRFIELILEERQRGKAIFMSSHRFDEVERTCTRAAIIREGKIAAIEDVGTLKTSQRKSYLVSVAGSDDMEQIRVSGLEYAMAGHNQVEIFVGDDYSKFLSTLAHCNVINLDVPNQTLEQAFIKYYGKEENPHVMDPV